MTCSCLQFWQPFCCQVSQYILNVSVLPRIMYMLHSFISICQAAERIIKEHYQSDVQSLFLTNAPSGVHTIELTSAEKASGDTQGKKVIPPLVTLLNGIPRLTVLFNKNCVVTNKKNMFIVTCYNAPLPRISTKKSIRTSW